MNFVQSLLPTIEHFHIIGYWAALLIVLLETTIGVGLLIPGSTIMLFMGALAAKGYFDLGDLLWFAAIGAIIGDNINYFVGKKYGPKIFTKGFWFIKPAHFEKGKKFFRSYGSKSVLIGRFIPGMKEVTPLVAGTFGMKWLSFTVWNILGAIGWSLIWILPGYFFAQSLGLAKIWLTRAGFFLIIFLAVFIILYILKIILIKKGKEFFSFFSSVWQSTKQAILENQKVKKITEQHKNFFQFLQRRLNKNNFFGLPLTLLLFALFYTFSLFGGIIEDIINSDMIVFADVRIANLLATFRNTELTKIFLWVTLLGEWQVILIFAVSAILVLWLWEKRSYIVPLILSLIGSEIFISAGKFVLHRARPSAAIYLENSFSFPSGHATIAVAFYGFITYLIIRNLKQWNKKINVFFIGFILISLIGFSRLYLGAHYVSDVWGGYLAGAIWLIVAISLSEYFLYKKRGNNAPSLNIKKRLVAAGIILTSIGLYTIFALNYQIPVSPPPQKINQITVNDAINIFNTDRLKYTETLLGDKREPLNFIIFAKNDRQLIDLFKQADWVLADNLNISSGTKLAKAILWRGFYSKAPITPNFWNTYVQNFSFEKTTDSNNIRVRHHARFWKTKYLTKNRYLIYVGTTDFNNDVKQILTHQISPDIDTGREFLFNDLQQTGIITNVKKQQFVKSEIGKNLSDDSFFTDGKLYLIFIKKR